VRFGEVFRFEAAHTLRSRATWIYAVLLLLFPVWISLGTFEGEIFYNAPVRMAFCTAIAAVFGLLVTAGLFADAAVRDVEGGMDPLLFTSGMSRSEYLFGRFLAALSVNVLLMLAVPVGLLLATGLRVADPVAPVRIAAYLQPLVLFALPSVLIASGLLFTVAMLGRQTIPVYLAAILLFISGIVSANYAGSIGNPLLSGLADPFGMSTFEVLSRRWTTAEQNTRLVGFPAALVVSRLAWISLSAAVLAALHARFRFAHGDGGRRRKRRRAAADHPLSERTLAVAIPRVHGSFGRWTGLRQTLAVARRCLSESAANRTFAFVLATAFGLTLLWGWNVGSTVFDTSVWPVTQLVASVAVSTRNQPIVLLLLALWAGEMVWRDRDVGMAEIGDASPVSEGAALAGRFLAVAASLVALEVVVVAAGVTLQALQGYHRFEPGVYLRIVFGATLANYLLLAALAMTIHVVVNHKYVGHILVVLAFVFTKAAGTFGIHHHLLVYGSDPGWTYSDMNGFGPFAAPFVWFKLYWAAWALLLLVVASVLWVRGPEPRVRRVNGRVRWERARFAGATVRSAGAAAALILCFGGFIFYNTNVLNEYRAPGEGGARQAEYEKRYARFASAPQPTIVALDERVEIAPEQRAVSMSGTYTLVNLSGATIDSVHVYTEPDVRARALTFDRGASPVLADSALGYRIFALDRPLAPRDSLTLSFSVSWRARGFPNDGIPTTVVENGTLFNRRILPFIGYQPILELDDARARRRFGLAPRPPILAPSDSAALDRRERVRNEDRVRVHAVVGTATDQTVVTSGELLRSWVENRTTEWGTSPARYFEYDTGRPESFGGTTLSGRYAVREDRWKDVTLRIYHHPEHTGSLASAMHGMKASLEYFSEQFAPYPYRDLRIAENPPYGDFGSAHPNLITFAESYFIFRVGDDEVDEPFYGAAHEVAHTWWGGMTRGAPVAGRAFLTESLANYSAMVLVAKTFGPAAARHVHDAQMNRYFDGRARVGREVPVLAVEDQPYISYRRGALALYALADLIGVDRVNGALRRYVDKYRDAGPPYPTSRDLYAELRAATPDSLHGLLSDMLETVTLWKVRTERATARRAATGAYEVTLDVVGEKVRADGEGRETEVPMDDLVEIGVFAKDGKEGAPLYLARHRVRSGRQTIRVTVPREPGRAGIDPYWKLFDPDRGDDVVTVRAISEERGR
jgi:ABC-type transport system involved in multi-copper enzyme maturation permease subunit